MLLLASILARLMEMSAERHNRLVDSEIRTYNRLLRDRGAST